MLPWGDHLPSPAPLSLIAKRDVTTYIVASPPCPQSRYDGHHVIMRHERHCLQTALLYCVSPAADSSTVQRPYLGSTILCERRRNGSFLRALPKYLSRYYVDRYGMFTVCQEADAELLGGDSGEQGIN